MRTKSRFIGVRLEPEQQRKLIVLSLKAGEPGNMSAALRWIIDNTPMPSISELADTERQLEGKQG